MPRTAEQIKQYNKEYYQRNKAKRDEAHKLWIEKNKIILHEYQHNYYYGYYKHRIFEDHELNIKRRKYKKLYYERNRKHMKEYAKQSYRDNIEYYKEFYKKRRTNFIDDVAEKISEIDSEIVLTELCEFYFKQFKQSYYNWYVSN